MPAGCAHSEERAAVLANHIVHEGDNRLVRRVIDALVASDQTTAVRSWGAILKTLLFTVLVPGSVAGWIPGRLRENLQATESFALRWTGIVLIAIGLAIYMHTAFWGFAVRGNGTPAPIAPTKRLVVEGLHRYVRNPMYIGVALVVLGASGAVPRLGHPGVSGRHPPRRSPVRSFLRRTDAGQEVRRAVRGISTQGPALDPKIRGPEQPPFHCRRAVMRCPSL